MRPPYACPHFHPFIRIQRSLLFHPFKKNSPLPHSKEKTLPFILMKFSARCRKSHQKSSSDFSLKNEERNPQAINPFHSSSQGNFEEERIRKKAQELRNPPFLEKLKKKNPSLFLFQLPQGKLNRIRKRNSLSRNSR